MPPRYPSLYQINTRVWLTELSRSLGRPATLDDIPDAELDRLAAAGFDWVWLLSRLADGRGRPRRLARESRLAPGIRGDAPGPPGRGHRRLGFAIAGYTGASPRWAATPRWRGCERACARAACG